MVTNSDFCCLERDLALLKLAEQTLSPPSMPNSPLHEALSGVQAIISPTATFRPRRKSDDGIGRLPSG